MKIIDGEHLRLCTRAGETIAELTVLRVNGPDVICAAEVVEADLPEIALLHDLAEASDDLAFAVMQVVEDDLAARGVALQDGSDPGGLRLGPDFSGLVMPAADRLSFALRAGLPRDA